MAVNGVEAIKHNIIAFVSDFGIFMVIFLYRVFVRLEFVQMLELHPDLV